MPKLAGASRSRRTWTRSRTRSIRRWGTLDLLDVLKDADFLTDVHRPSSPRSPPARRIDRDALRKRLLLVLFALGTNMGIKRDRAPPATTATPRPRCGTCAGTFVTRDNLRRAIATAGQRHLRGARPALVGRRHRVRVGLEEVRLLGVEPDDRVARPLRRPRRDDLLARRTQAPSASTRQLKTCSSSEVAAMIEGLLRHCTDADDRPPTTSTPTARRVRRVRVHRTCSASGCCPG